MSGPVGIFDSGVGGLTVLVELRKRLPGEDFIYFGDTGRVPYGIKGKETVTRYSIEIANYLLVNRDIKALVIACNTSSALAFEDLKKIYRIPLFEVVVPAVRRAAKTTVTGKIGVIGTRSTIQSGAYRKRLKELNGNLKVFQKACPLFVPLVEEGWVKHKITGMVVEEYLKGLKKRGIDTLILGCTHYPFLRDVLREFMGPEVSIVDSATAVAEEVKSELVNLGMARRGGKGMVEYLVTDDPLKFSEFAEKMLGEKVGNVRRVVL